MHPATQRQLAASIASLEVTLPKIRRSVVVANSLGIHQANTVAYSMDAWCSHGYRNDCSGKVSEWFGIPLDAPGSWHGLNTVNMVTGGYFRRIPASDLRPGDVVGIMGAGTAGANGHVRLFVDWVTHDDPDDNRYVSVEQSLGSTGPDRATHNDLADAGLGPYHAYRYVAIEDDPVPDPTPDPTPSDGQYRIEQGDTLGEVAQRHGWGDDWRGLYALNRDTLDAAARARGEDDADGGNLIFPGTIINVRRPGEQSWTGSYTITSGDALGAIATRYGTDRAALYERNAAAIEAAAVAHGRANSRGGPSKIAGWWIYPGTVLIVPN